MIFELAVGGPFQANELRRQDREPRVPSRHNCAWISDWVVATGRIRLCSQSP
jgi:hypothetical protein